MQPNGLPQHCGFLLLFLVSSDEMCVDSLSLSEGVCLRVLLILEYQLSERQRGYEHCSSRGLRFSARL